MQRRSLSAPKRQPAILIIGTGLLALLASSCGDELQEIVDQLAFVAELDVVENLPQVTIVSEDSTDIETLDCA